MSVIVPDTARPTNLHLPADATVRMIDGDLYNICDRVREISPRLYVLLLEGDAKYSFAIMEKCEDGVDRLVFRVKELDGRVIKRLHKIMSIPLDARYEQLEREEYRLQEEVREERFEQLYEALGRPMWTELERAGFIQRGVSYPKRGIKSRIKGVAGH